MDNTPISLPATEDMPPEEQFFDLYDAAMQLVPQYSSDIWTDYNAHDPGVTIVEQICYALTEVGYRANASAADLLSDGRGRIPLGDLNLFGPRRMFPTAPLTVADLQRLVLDRIPGLCGAWIAAAPNQDASHVHGVYDVRVFAPDHGESAPRRAALRERVRRLLSRRRNLCEDVGRVILLRPRLVELTAAVELDRDAPPELTVAAMLRRLELQLAPEVRRHGLTDLLLAGAAPSDVAEGPPLRHGWIAPDDLAPRLTHTPWSVLRHAMAASPDVTAVNGLAFDIRGGASDLGDAPGFVVGEDEVLQLDLGRSGRSLDVKARRGGAAVELDFDRVRAIVARLRAEQRAPAPLFRQMGEHRPPPSTAAHQSFSYASIQRDLPQIYGLGEDEKPDEPPRVRQLRGYLLGFDLQIAKALAIIETAGSARAPDAAAETLSFFNRFRKEAPGAESLLQPDAWLLARETAEWEAYWRRRLLRRLGAYGYAVEDLGPLGASLDGLTASLAFATRRPAARRRAPGLGSPIYRRSDLEQAIGMRWEIDETRRPLREALRALRVEIAAPSEGPGVDGRSAHLIDPALFEAMAHAPQGEAPERVRPIRLQLPPAAFDHPADIRFGRDGDGRWATAMRIDGECWRLTRHEEHSTAARAARSLAAKVEAARRATTRLHLIEHVMLRFGRAREDGFAYASTFTVAVCAPDRMASPVFRQDVARDVRNLAPAHLHARTVFIDVETAAMMEERMLAWREALTRGDGDSLRKASRAMHDLLADTVEEPAW